MNRELFIRLDYTIKDALKQLDKTAEKVLFVVDSKKRLLGTISDGDIRRYIINGNGINLKKSIESIFNSNPIFIYKDDYDIETIKRLFIKNKINLIPILNKQKIVVDSITWDIAFSNEKTEKYSANIQIPVVIMAGGKGTRLEPFTNIFPKALVPVGSKTIIELIINEFLKHGVKDFYATLNYKGFLIESYFKNLNKDYNIDFYYENEFLGTAGSLKLLENVLEDDFILSNCDILVKADYSAVLKEHKRKKASLTILSAVKHYQIPYGVIKFKRMGEVVTIHEKPEYTFTVNTGVYILNKNTLKYIPENKFFNMNELIDELIKDGKKIQIYPVNENDYHDIGQWKEYQDTINKLGIGVKE